MPKAITPELHSIIKTHLNANTNTSNLAEYIKSVYPDVTKGYTKTDSLRRVIDNYKKMIELDIQVEVKNDKKVGEFDFREHVEHVKETQRLHQKASWSQDSANIEITTNADHLIILPLADLHIGAISTDYDMFLAFTDLILNTPNLYVILVGDLADNFVAFKNMLAIHQQAINPVTQYLLIQKWIEEIKHKILFTTWSNHPEFEERATGNNKEKEILSRNCIYFNGIGYAYIIINGISYKIASTHKTKNHSQFNALHGALQLFRNDIRDADIYIVADKHTPNHGRFTIGPDSPAAIMTGTLKKDDGYTKRNFASFTQTTMPCFTLDTREKDFCTFWNVRQALKYAQVPFDKELVERLRERKK
jgi:hypothetical protein